MNNPNPLTASDKRIIVIGTTGSGKTMLAQAIAQKYTIPHVELDALYWGPEWTPYPEDVFRTNVEQATEGDNWVIDGNHSNIRDIVWPRATTLIWLDYALPMILRHLVKRTTRRLIFREELWQGNRETWRNQFVWRIASRSFRRVTGQEEALHEKGPSIDDEISNTNASAAQTLNAHQRRRAVYPQLFELPEAAHLNIIILHSPREAGKWLESNQKPEIRDHM